MVDPRTLSDPSPTSAADLAAELEALGAPGELDLADALGLAPPVIEQLVDRALALAGAGRVDDAELLLVRISRVDTRSALVPYLLAALRAEAGEPAAALSACAEARRRHPDGGDPMTAEIALLEGRALLAMRRPVEARAALEQAAEVAGPARGPARALLDCSGASGDAG